MAESSFDQYVATHTVADLVDLAAKRIQQYLDDEDGDLTALESAITFLYATNGMHVDAGPFILPREVDDPWTTEE